MRILLLLPFVIMACNSEPKKEIITDQDLKEINALHDNYRKFWLENDSAKVLSLFAEDGALIPPGNSGGFVKGKAAMGAWWFTTADDTTYPITGFDFKKDTLLVVDNHTAIFEGVSSVSWNTVKGDSIVSSSTSSSNFITVCIKENGEWKILRQIWNVRPKKK